MSSSPMHLTGPAATKPEREGLSVVPVLIAIAVIGLIALAAYQIMAAKAKASVSVTGANAVEMPPGDRVVVEVEFSMLNHGDKPLKYHSSQIKLQTDSQELKDDPAATAEGPRIYASYPALKKSAEPPLKQDMMVQPGGTLKGTVIVAYPVNKATFDARKDLQAIVYFYDESPIASKK